MKRHTKMCPQTTFVYFGNGFPENRFKKKISKAIFISWTVTVKSFFECTGYVCFLEVIGLKMVS